jgi:DNA polymerase kappa
MANAEWPLPDEVDDDDVELSQREWLPVAPAAAPKQAGRRFDTVFTNAKAGMDKVDVEHVRAVVLEASKDSDFYKEQQRRDAATDARVVGLLDKLDQLSPLHVAAAERALAPRLAKLESGRDLSRHWLVVDMDAFFASVEERDDPRLKTLAMAVGGIGMISTANYVARRYGVRSAMPGFIGRKLCPQLIFVPCSFDKYTAAAEETRAIFARFDPQFMSGSLDEAYLDITQYCATNACTPEACAAALRDAVRTETRLTCSCGLGPNQMIAKIASDKNKPDGQFCVPNTLAGVRAFMTELPIRKVPGVGRVSERVLSTLGVATCGDMLRLAPQLSLVLGAESSMFRHALASALGLGETQKPPPLAPGELGRRGMSVERTFGDCSDPGELEQWVSQIATTLSEHMQAEGLRCRSLTLKLKTAAFEVRTRQVALPAPSCTAEQLLAPALRLLRAEMPVCCRLLGLRASAFQQRVPPPPGQRMLPFEVEGAGGDGGGGHAEAADAQADMESCARCGARTAPGAATVEHADWHMARDLHHTMREEEHHRSEQPPAKKGKAAGNIATLFQRQTQRQ